MQDLYAPMIRAWLGRYGLPECDLDDIVQTVLAAVVASLPDFQHNGRVGAFRSWLRTITINSVRQKFRMDHRRLDAPGRHALLDGLGESEDPDSGLSRLWDQAHDAHVLQTLMTWAEPEFAATTWQAFRRQVLEEARPDVVAAELGTTINAVLIAKSRVLKRLRNLSRGLVD
jgi:RNA polymerase sigma-70 factor (ECF subfamily)